MPQPDEVHRLGDELIERIRAAWDRIVAEHEALVALAAAGKPSRRRAVAFAAMVERLMREVERDAAAWVRASLPAVYAQGAVDAGVGSFVWGQTHTDAMRALAGEMWDDVLAATRFVSLRSKQLIRSLGRVETARTIVESQTAVQGGRNLARSLRERGIWAVTYRDGSRHGLAEYASMLVRTQSARAYNLGAVNQAITNGVRYFECADGADCGLINHDDADKANGSIRSAEDALRYAVSHPNCRRVWMARPDLSAANAAEARPTTTQAQRDDARAFEAARDATTRARAARRAVLARREARLARNQKRLARRG